MKKRRNKQQIRNIKTFKCTPSGKFPHVKLTWYDANFESEWLNPDDVNEWDEKKTLGTVVGWLIKKDKKWITLAMVNSKTMFMGTLRVLTKSVEDIKYYKD